MKKFINFLYDINFICSHLNITFYKCYIFSLYKFSLKKINTYTIFIF